MFPVAEFLKPITWNSLQDVDAHRKIIFEAIVKYRKMKNQGVVAVFKRDRFDRYSNFAASVTAHWEVKGAASLSSTIW